MSDAPTFPADEIIYFVQDLVDPTVVEINVTIEQAQIMKSLVRMLEVLLLRSEGAKDDRLTILRLAKDAVTMLIRTAQPNDEKTRVSFYPTPYYASQLAAAMPFFTEYQTLAEFDAIRPKKKGTR